MGGVAAVVGVISAITGGAMVAGQVETARRTKKAGKQAINQQNEAQAALLKEKKTREAEELRDLTSQVQQQKSRRQVGIRRGATKGGTLLTSPIGVTGQAATAGKTLLGT